MFQRQVRVLSARICVNCGRIFEHLRQIVAGYSGVNTEFGHMKFHEMWTKFGEILAKFHYCKTFIPTSHSLCYSTEQIKLKLLLFCKINTNFVLQKIWQNFATFLKM
jgi:hypothetical protein